MSRSVSLPVDLSKTRYVSFKHFGEDFNVKVLFHTLLGAKVLQHSGDVREKELVQ